MGILIDGGSDRKLTPWKFEGFEWWWHEWDWGKDCPRGNKDMYRAFDIGPLRLVWVRDYK